MALPVFCRSFLYDLGVRFLSPLPSGPYHPLPFTMGLPEFSLCAAREASIPEKQSPAYQRLLPSAARPSLSRPAAFCPLLSEGLALSEFPPLS